MAGAPPAISLGTASAIHTFSVSFPFHSFCGVSIPTSTSRLTHSLFLSACLLSRVCFSFAYPRLFPIVNCVIVVIRLSQSPFRSRVIFKLHAASSAGGFVAFRYGCLRRSEISPYSSGCINLIVISPKTD